MSANASIEDFPIFGELTVLAEQRYQLVRAAAVICEKITATIEEAPADIQKPYHPQTIISEILWALHGNELGRAEAFLRRLSEYGDERRAGLVEAAKWMWLFNVDQFMMAKGDFPLITIIDELDYQRQIGRLFTGQDFSELGHVLLRAQGLTRPIEQKPALKIVRRERL
jgi:hypothetical protein